MGSTGISEQIITIEAYRLTAMNLVLSPNWREQLDRLNRIRAVYGTTALEGNPLSEAEVSHQMDVLDGQARSTAVLSREQIQIRNADFARSWVKERFAPGGPSVTVADILRMHRMITQQSDEINNVPGKFRDFSVQVGSTELGGVHLGAPYEELPELMEGFVEFLNSRTVAAEHPVVKALLAHFFLITIHPFGDGNGRVSRLLEAGMLSQYDYNIYGFYGLSNFFYRNDQEYKTNLQRCRQTGPPYDVMPFLSFGVQGFADELVGVNNFIKTKINRVMYRQMLVTNYNKRVSQRRRMLNEREYQLLTYLLRETEPVDPFANHSSERITLANLFDSSYVQAAYSSVTRRTFIRELLRLAEQGFINFEQANDNEDTAVEIDFDAIAKYQMS